MAFTVISYYTQDWHYPQYARALQQACDRFDLKHHIVERTSTGAYVGNCQIKPFFIQECLETMRSPVFWIDADGALLARPSLLMETACNTHDIIGNTVVERPDRLYVSSIGFNYTDVTRRFVAAWCDEVAQRKSLDHAAFHIVWEKMKNDINFLSLPPEYFCILRTPKSDPPSTAVIAHRLSDSELKMIYKTAQK